MQSKNAFSVQHATSVCAVCINSICALFGTQMLQSCSSTFLTFVGHTVPFVIILGTNVKKGTKMFVCIQCDYITQYGSTVYIGIAMVYYH